MREDRFAIAYTVKNEARLLPAAIEFHLAAGCAQIIVFLDGTTDDTAEQLARYPEVSVRNTLRPDELIDPPEWIVSILPWWETDMDVRKRINSYYAARWADAAGIEWLVSIDPDELLYNGSDAAVGADYVGEMLRTVGPEVDQILLRVLEAVPVAAHVDHPFHDCVLFLTRFPATEWVWRYSRALLVRLFRRPKLVAWYDYWFYWLRFGGALPRMVRDPRDGTRVPATYFWGYTTYKSCIRTARAADFNFVVHEWRKFRRRPRSAYRGGVLHYDLPDAAYFSAKFRQRQQSTLQEQFYLRYALAMIARELPEDQVEQFFRDNIAISDPARIARLKRMGIVRKIRTAADFMEARGGEEAK